MALAVLSIDLEARLAKLDEGMTRAQRLVERSGAQMERAFLGATRAATSLITIVGGVGFGALARSVLNGVDALNDFADATGTSVENASALEDIAARTGTSMDSAAGAVVRFNKELAETAKKDSEAARIFEKLGLNAAELRALDPAEALLKTAQALQGVASDGDKARLVQQLFGKSVREVAPFLKDLAEAGQLNATVTTEQAKAAEDFNKAIFSLQKDITDLARGAMQPLLEALTQVGGAFKSADQYAGELTGSAAALAVPIQALTVLGTNVAFVFKGVGTEIGAISAQAAALLRGDMAAVRAIRAEALQDAANARASLDQFERRVLNIDGKANTALRNAEDRGFTPVIGSRIGSIGDGKPVQSVTDALSRIQSTDEKKLARIRAELTALINLRKGGTKVPDQAFALLADDLAKVDPAAIRAAESLKRFEEAREKATEMARKADEAASKAADDLFAGNEALRDEIALIGKSADERSRLEQARISNIIAGKEEALIGLQNAGASEAQIAALQREIELLRQRRSLVAGRADAESRNVEPALERQTRAASDAARELGLTFSSAAEEALVKFDGLRGVLKGLEADLLRLAARKLITEPLANVATNFFSGLFGGGGGLTQSGSKDSSGTNYAALIGSFAGMFAKGGYIPPGQWGIAGERGAEPVFGGRTGATVLPAGGRSSTFVFNAAPGGSRMSQQQQAQDFFRLGAQAAGRNG